MAAAEVLIVAEIAMMIDRNCHNFFFIYSRSRKFYRVPAFSSNILPFSYFSLIFLHHSYNDSSRSHGGGSNLENFNTYGLSVKFLEGLGITQGPLHNKVFVANVSNFFTLFCSSFLIDNSLFHLIFAFN